MKLKANDKCFFTNINQKDVAAVIIANGGSTKVRIRRLLANTNQQNVFVLLYLDPSHQISIKYIVCLSIQGCE